MIHNLQKITYQTR